MLKTSRLMKQNIRFCWQLKAMTYLNSVLIHRQFLEIHFLEKYDTLNYNSLVFSTIKHEI